MISREGIYLDLAGIYFMIPQREEIIAYAMKNIDIGNPVDEKVLNTIENLAERYGKDKHGIEVIYTIIYAGMMAEQLKDNAVMGKSVKLLGLHQVLREDMNCKAASEFSKGKTVEGIREECKKRFIPYEFVASWYVR